MIVTPDGLNVFPEDVERVLNAAAGVRESAVVGVAARRRGARARGARARAGRRRRTTSCARPTRGCRTISAFAACRSGPTGELPRTEGHPKAASGGAIRDWVVSGAKPVDAAGGDSLEALMARFARGRDVSGATTLEELGLSSLERVELMVALEDRFQTRIDEARFAEAAQRRRPASGSSSDRRRPRGASEPVDFPSWNRTWPVRLDPAAVARHLDPAARTRLRLRARRRARAPPHDSTGRWCSRRITRATWTCR